jgi:dienelactone hydrolase
MKREELGYSVGGKSFVGQLAHAGAPDRRWPGVLVCHDAGGLREHALERACRLAELGYAAYALDLFGEPILGTEHAKATIASLTGDLPTLRARLNAGLAALKSHPGVDGARTAVIGFCKVRDRFASTRARCW